MFVKKERDAAFKRINTDTTTKHLFHKSTLFGTKKRAAEKLQEERRLADEEKTAARLADLQRRSAGIKIKKKSPTNVKDRFAQERQLGQAAKAQDQDGYVPSRWVQPVTTKNAGKLAPWAESSPDKYESTFKEQVFPLWDVETVAQLKSRPPSLPRRSVNLVDIPSSPNSKTDKMSSPDTPEHSKKLEGDNSILPHLPVSTTLVKSTTSSTSSWSQQSYGLERLSPGAASAVVLAWNSNFPVCKLGEGCYERSLSHLRSARHCHLEKIAMTVIRGVTAAGDRALVEEDGFLTREHHDLLHPLVPRSKTSQEYRADPLREKSVRRPLPPPNCRWGKFKLPMGSYEGYVKSGPGYDVSFVPHGRGEMMWNDGNCYRGDWSNGVMEGELGEFWDGVDGSLYRGNWKHGRREGQGEYWLDGTNREGERYKGGFINGSFEGHGEYRLKSGRILYVGMWKDDEWNGVGSIFWRNGTLKFKGGWKRGIKHGQGSFHRPDSQLAYRGQFQNGRYHGRGKFFDPRERKATGWANGTWVNGELTGENCEVTFYVSENIFVHYVGNVDRGRICSYGKVQYPDKRVSHGLRKRVRLPVIRNLGQDAKNDRDDNSLWSAEGQCWIGGDVNAGYVNDNKLARQNIAEVARKKLKRGKNLTQEEKDVLKDLEEERTDKEEQEGKDEQEKGEVVVMVEEKINEKKELKKTRKKTGEMEKDTEQATGERMATVAKPQQKKSVSYVVLECKGTIVYPDDSRYDGVSIQGFPHGDHGLKIGPQGTCEYGRFENGKCVEDRSKGGSLVEGVAWRLVVYKLKNVTSSGDLTVYHNGSRLHDQYEPMSATAALWLWFQGQERGCFGGDKVRDRFGPTMRSSQLDMIFEAVKRRRDLCGTVRLAKRARGVDADGNDWGETKVLLRGQSPVSKRKEFKTIFEHVRGNSVWPKETQHTYKALVQYLRSTMD